MGGIDRSIRLVAPRHQCLAGRNVQIVEHTAEHGQRSKRLVEGDFMTCLIDTHEAEIPILPYFAILSPVNYKGRVARSAEFCGVRVVDLEGNSLPTKPVADVVGITVVHSYTNGVVEDRFEVCEEVWINKVACFLEGVIDISIGVRVVQVDAEGGLGGGEVEVVGKVSGRCGICVGMADAAKL